MIIDCNIVIYCNLVNYSQLNVVKVIRHVEQKNVILYLNFMSYVIIYLEHAL